MFALPSRIQEQTQAKRLAASCELPQASWEIGMLAFQTKPAKSAFTEININIPIDYMESGLCSRRGDAQTHLWSLRWDPTSGLSVRSERGGAQPPFPAPDEFHYIDQEFPSMMPGLG